MNKIEIKITHDFWQLADKLRTGNLNRLINNEYSSRDAIRYDMDTYILSYKLWGHRVFWYDGNEFYFCCCGYNTQTTKSRVNAFLFVFSEFDQKIRQKNSILYCKDKKIDEYTTYKLVGNTIAAV